MQFEEAPLFPRLDERFAGNAYRHGYYAASTVKDGGDGFNTIVHHQVPTDPTLVAMGPAVVTLDHAKKLLAQDLPILETSLELGLSGPSRLHDLFVTHEAMSPGIYKAKGEGLDISFGFHNCQFGRALIMATKEGMAGMAFCDMGEEAATLEDMKGRWPRANYNENPSITSPYAARSLDPSLWCKDQPLRVVLIGTDFEVRVWEGLLKIPLGTAHTYSGVANAIGAPNASRAVGRAVGRNPLSFVVPCHRVVG